MSENPHERRVTTDREEIRRWLDDRDAVPATRRTDASEPDDRTATSHEYTVATRDRLGEEYDELEWETFFSTIEDEGLVFVYRDSDEGLESVELLEREAMLDRSALEDDRLEAALREGETVTTELVETRVVEREIVETDTIETELIDTELVDREVVATEILERDPIEVEFLTDDALEVGTAGVLEVFVEERRIDTIEELELLTVESRIVDVDVDVDERDELELEGARTRVGDETIQRAIVESDVVHTSGDVDTYLEEGRIETRRTEGETIESRVVERRTLETEVRDRRRLVFTLEESEIVETEVVDRTLIDAELLDVGDYAEASGPRADPAATSPADTPTDADTAPVEGEPAHTAGAEEPIQLADHDRGKAVVDAAGEQVGIVADIEEERFYIDPEAGLTDRLKARFNWGEPDRDAYPVSVTEIEDITDDEVVLRGHDEP
ncbi:hypothetical protein GCM10025298_01970 [Natronobiforma cellulositropha]